MQNSFSSLRNSLARFFTVFVLALSLLGMSGCATLFGVKQKVEVPPLLTPLVEATTAQLVAEVNRLASVRSIRGKVDLQFQDTSFAESGIAEKYRTADGDLILQRPGQIRLAIQGPFSVDIAQMTSDGAHFRVAVLKGNESYRRFVRGTNSAVYSKLTTGDNKAERQKDGKSKEASEQRAVSALSNLRPQHLTDALLVRPVEARDQSGLVYARTEFYQEEPDARTRSKTGARVVRSYYLLDELAPGGESGARLMRRFWFDRVGAVRLARMQTFDNTGALITDVEYGEMKPFGEGGTISLPSRIIITRPQDRYKISLSYQAPDAVTLNKEFDPTIFVLENKWQLPEVDLDAKK
ncbi:MAG: hypothetical protein WCB68_01545 [Pyrinomonadaceae bacterium]